MHGIADGIDRDLGLDYSEGDLDAYRDKKSVKELNNQFEVAIGDGMEFTIHGKFFDEYIFLILLINLHEPGRNFSPGQ